MTKTEEKSRNALKRKANSTPEKGNDIFSLLNRMDKPIEYALTGTNVQKERYLRLIITELRNNAKLASCTPESILGAVMQSAQLGLEPNTSLGLAYLIPYGNQCQFQLGYRGLLTLASRTGEIVRFDAQTVYENDYFEYRLGWEAKLDHVPAMENRGNPIGYYGLYKTKDGGGNFCFMSVEDVTNHAKKFSKTFKNGPWQTDFDSMAKKTVLKQALKYAPLSVEVQQFVEADETIKNMKIDDLKNNVNALDIKPEIILDDEPEKEEKTEKEKKVEELQSQLGQENIFS